MNKYPYIQLWVNDLMNDPKVAPMTTLAFGAYCRLLFKYAWHQDPVGTLPNDDSILARWADLTAEEWDGVKVSVRSCFRPKKDGRLHQRRMKDEYDKLIKSIEERSDNGRKAANAKHSKDRESRAIAVRKHYVPHAIQTADSNSNTDLKADSSPADAGLVELKVELAMAGIGDPKLSELSRRLNALNAEPLDVRMAWIETRRAKKGPGWLIRKLEGGLPPMRLTAKTVIDLVNAGEVVRINGHPVSSGWVGRDPRENLVIFGMKCMNFSPDHRPDPVETIGAGNIDSDMLTLSGHEQAGEANAA